ncbi:IQ motif, EF-hand binding site [Sesbania bispinosa]|nr:IQ motif, EF-hand binding site [Sesbania bispinosa]
MSVSIGVSGNWMLAIFHFYPECICKEVWSCSKRERQNEGISPPQDAALAIQISFRAYLIRRSKALRALRELAIAKSKLKEIRAQFNNFSYRRHVARDAEERQRFF